MLWSRRSPIVFVEDGVHAFYLNSFLRNLYMGMTVIFTPLFLYSYGSDYFGTSTLGLLLVVGFYFVQRFILLCMVFPLSRVIEKIGFRRSVTSSIVFLIFYTASLVGVSYSLMWVLPAALFLAIQTPLYWIARDSVISQDSPKRSMGTTIAMLLIWEKVAVIIGPLLGGLLVASYGYMVLYLVAGLTLVLSIPPIVRSGIVRKNSINGQITDMP